MSREKECTAYGKNGEKESALLKISGYVLTGLSCLLKGSNSARSTRKLISFRGSILISQQASPSYSYGPPLRSALSFYIACDKASNFTVKIMLSSAFCFPHFLLDISFKEDSHYRRSSVGVLAL